MNPQQVTPKNISNFRQNKVSIIVDDLVGRDADKHSRDGVFKILLARGVFKWFCVRRAVIRLKYRWKDRIVHSLEAQKEAAHWGKWAKVHELRGYRRGVEECREDIRRLCRSDRWSVDFKDSRADQWLVDRFVETELATGSPKIQHPLPTESIEPETY